MISPARRHFQKAMAAASAAAVSDDEPQTSDAYLLTKAALLEDRRRLSDIKSIERKIEAKRDMLPTYEPYITGVLEAGTGANDDVLMTVMIWYLDIGDIAKAIPIAEYALAHNLQSPDQYQRSAATILVEETADTLLRKDIKPIWKEGDIQNPISDDHRVQLEYLQVIETLTAQHDMHDQVRAKLYKTIGYLYAVQRNYAGALAMLTRALELDKNCGVKKDIERLQPKAGSA